MTWNWPFELDSVFFVETVFETESCLYRLSDMSSSIQRSTRQSVFQSSEIWVLNISMNCSGLFSETVRTSWQKDHPLRDRWEVCQHLVQTVDMLPCSIWHRNVILSSFLSSEVLHDGVRVAIFAIECSVSTHSFTWARASGYMDCVHSVESSVAYRSTLPACDDPWFLIQLLPMNRFILRRHIYHNVGWPARHELDRMWCLPPTTPFGAVGGSSRTAVYSRQIVVNATFVS